MSEAYSLLGLLVFLSLLVWLCNLKKKEVENETRE